MKIKNSAGANVVLNFFEGEGFAAALRSITKHCKFFQFSQNDMRKNEKLGKYCVLLLVYNVFNYLLSIIYL